MRNLELKVRCSGTASLDHLITVAQQAGAQYRRTLHQRDTYFAAQQGRLKLREWHQPTPADDTPAGPTTDLEAAPAGATLIAYHRPNTASSRESDYLLYPTDHPEMLRATLAQALGITVVVSKVRVLYLWGQTRIHFDRVDGLGAFVELETLLDQFPNNPAAAQAEHQQVVSALGLDQLPVVAGSYSDLLSISTD